MPEVIEAVAAGRHVFVVEGEKDVETLRSHGLVATTNAGGAGKWRKEYDSYLYDGRVVVIADNDDAGREHARSIGRDSALDSRTESFVILELPELPEHGDVADWFNAGHTVEELKQLVSEAESRPVPNGTADEASSQVSQPDELEPVPNGTADDISTAELLERVKVALERFVVFTNEQQAIAVAVWVLHTYIFVAFDTTPYLYVSSATKQSGKTRLFEVLVLLVCKPWMLAGASASVLFRKIEIEAPTPARRG